MEDIKYMNNLNNPFHLSVHLNKICNSIRKAKTRNPKVDSTPEAIFLMNQCKSEAEQLRLLSCHAFVQLVDERILELSRTLTMFISMLPEANPQQCIVYGEAIISLLLLELKWKQQSAKQVAYLCPFKIKYPQHPLITLFEMSNSNLIDLSNKVSSIINHHDMHIKHLSVEFLRPVFLSSMCKKNPGAEALPLWSCLLSVAKKSGVARRLVKEILMWSRTSTPTSCLFTNTILTSALDVLPSSHALPLIIHLTFVTNRLIVHGNDPRSNFNRIQLALNEFKPLNSYVGNIILIQLADSMQNIAPIYTPDLMRLIKCLIINNGCSNAIINHMIYDGLILWLSNPAFVPSGALNDIQALVEHIRSQANSSSNSRINTDYSIESELKHIKYVEANLSLAFDLAKFADALVTQDNNSKKIDAFIEWIGHDTQLVFCLKIDLFIRGLLFSELLSESQWLKLFEILSTIIQCDDTVAMNCFLPLVFYLNSSKYPSINLAILKCLPNFGNTMDNIPLLLKTLKSLCLGLPKPFCIELYKDLWEIEPRTYPFLSGMLPKDERNITWDLQVARAMTIKFICELRPTLHGKEFVGHLSTIFNESTTEYDDLATSLALDSIVLLCQSNTVNIVSTWKALSSKFKNEQRTRSLQSLCKLFGQVPLLKQPTKEYELLFDEAFSQLWSFVFQQEQDPDVTEAALKALKNYNIKEISLNQMPQQLCGNVQLPKEVAKTIVSDGDESNSVDAFSYIPGECWIELLRMQNIEPPYWTTPQADLVVHYISQEIKALRGNIFTLPEGRMEPTSLTFLPAHSVLKHIFNYISTMSKNTKDAGIIETCLSILGRKYVKLIPPVNWTFLKQYYKSHEGLCLKIVARQALNSPSAKKMLISFLEEIDFNDTQKVTIVIDNFMHILMSAPTGLFSNIVTSCFKVALKQLIFFNKLLYQIELSLKSDDCKDQENFGIVLAALEECYDRIEIEDPKFVQFVIIICQCPLATIDDLTIPDNWYQPSVIKLRKAILIRSRLVLKKKENPLNFLNPIIDRISIHQDEQPLLFCQIVSVFRKFPRSKYSCFWILELLGKIQTLLTASSDEANIQTIFLCDLLVLSVCLFSGTLSISTNFNPEDELYNRQACLDAFPHSIRFLFEREVWMDSQMRINEFLFHIASNSKLPLEFAKTFKISLVTNKNLPHFEAIWTKYIEMRLFEK